MPGSEIFQQVSGVSRETSDRLDFLEHLVRKWNPSINLVSKDSLPYLRSRHVNDSIQIFSLVDFTKGNWCDLGSGGGFPGLVVAILAHETKKQLQVKLVESDGRKAAFLREAIRQLEIEATVVNSRIEDLQPLGATVISARALASLSRLCGYAERHLSAEGVALFPKGATYQCEVDEARKNWAFDITLHPSKTHITAAILEFRNIRHV
ncbi:16S rRNA (guanine(527)-N(7))-methyltransferase RsmG [Pseudotabrizicola alkalilacus]|uniref:Ribosomal RNA small subunit methyltransferase G n=1 Tax=Pseudotabrizicola alkalilacus TaxID=2305252 RepID=A0A411YY72_9RHOB|nr:16S rRNA (guanine(527)-N(7))-methyltransferase RsmG [Pseudotabrizicola alkalilacus]RGP35854.1 16S rRNA (guanine(527)-N(7))-methyltransferase RsmG [Pseudotabrizicola alkalilacus]